MTIQRRIALFTFLLLGGVAIAVPVMLTWQQVRKEQLNHALIAAIKRKGNRATPDLLRRGADASTQDTSSSSTQSVSLWTQFLNLLRVQRPSSGDAPTPRALSALSLAIVGADDTYCQCNARIIRALIEHGADVNCKDAMGWTPLIAICNETDLTEKDRAALVKLLLDKGADPHIRDDDDDNVLIATAGAGHTEAVRVLIARASKDGLEMKYRDGEIALIHAAWGRSFDQLATVRVLLQAGAAPNAEDDFGWTPLWRATFDDCLAGPSSPDVMRCLLTHGAKMRGTQKGSLLGWAARGKKVEALQILLDAGARVNAREPDGLSPLIKAIQPPDSPRWGDPADCVRLLLAHGANPNMPARDGQTPLQVARASGEAEVVRLLRQAGARK